MLAALFGLATPAPAATDYPQEPIQIVVPFTPGGNTDLIARLIADRLQASFKPPVTVVNRPGGGMNIGSAFVANSRPDGYTMLLGAPGSFVVNQFIYTNLTYNPDTAWAPVSLAARFPNVLVVHPSLGVKSIQELIAKAKAEPGKVDYAIAGIGTTSHLCGALFAEMAGIAVNAIPYKGTSQSLQDLVAGRVLFTIDNLGPILPFIKSGQLLALGVSTADPVSLLAGVPPIATVLKGLFVELLERGCDAGRNPESDRREGQRRSESGRASPGDSGEDALIRVRSGWRHARGGHRLPEE
jgi:tripartite-type tricarboxylate transporter receptor subunit TctC